MRIVAEWDTGAWRLELDRIGRAVAAERVLPRAAAILRQDFLAQFQAGGSPAWAPLQPATVAKKAAMGYPRAGRDGLPPANLVQKGSFGPGNILIMTGALLASWTQADAPGHIERIDGDELEMGSELVYAATHQYGDRRLAWGRVMAEYPARPLRIRDEAVDRIARLIEAEASGA